MTGLVFYRGFARSVALSFPQGRRSLWTGGTCPPIFMKGGGTSMVMSPQYFRSDVVSTRVTATVVCCILTQILCVVSQKSFSFWGTSSLDPAGKLCPPCPLPGPSLLLCPPNNPVRSTPLLSHLGYTQTNLTKRQSAALGARPVHASFRL